jgi:hypothetical protein
MLVQLFSQAIMRINFHLKAILSNTFTQTHNTKILFCRVASIDSTNGVNGKLDYDKEKYKEMILDAAETVLGYFGFDRSVYGNKKNIGPRKWRWLQELRQEREKDVRTEVI